MKITLRNGDFLIASKMRSINFSNFHSLHPKMVHRAVFCATFLRKKVAKRMFNKLKKIAKKAEDGNDKNLNSGVEIPILT